MCLGFFLAHDYDWVFLVFSIRTDTVRGLWECWALFPLILSGDFFSSASRSFIIYLCCFVLCWILKRVPLHNSRVAFFCSCLLAGTLLCEQAAFVSQDSEFHLFNSRGLESLKAVSSGNHRVQLLCFPSLRNHCLHCLMSRVFKLLYVFCLLLMSVSFQVRG